MSRLQSLCRRWPVGTFSVLAFAITWLFILLTPVSLLFPIMGLFGPAAAAFSIAGLSSGWNGVRQLRDGLGIWRVPCRWYLVAIGLPVALAAAVATVGSALGSAWSPPAVESVPLLGSLAVLVVGEEIGWRGFALPRLVSRWGAPVASVILGAIWASWHLGNVLIPGLERYLSEFPAFLAWVTAQTVLFAWIALRTRFSILIAWLFHAAINVSGAVFALTDPALQWRVSAVLYALVALLVVARLGSTLGAKPEEPISR